ncbi:casein kinase substrate phosphoprotein PP28-domain-containing protein [Tirmania nivea]|nr:casein kinase substrate phosphoprotein PP28-domain-containing protein [Tirmania nivea]
MSGKRGGKFSKPTRGGGKKFTRNLKPLDEPEDRPGMWDEEPAQKESDSGDEEDEGTTAMTREERRAADKVRKEAAIARKKAAAATSDDEEEEEDSASIGNPNLAPENPNAPGNASSGGISRRAREAKEAAAAKERWQKMHLAGKTDEAKADLARLALIKKEREEKAKQRQAELEERKAAAAIKLEASGRKR